MIENNITTKNTTKNKDITMETNTTTDNLDNSKVQNEQSTSIKWMCNFFIRTITYMYVITKIYVLWICLHYVASHLYIYLCVPKTVWGFIASPFMSITPQCQVLRWIIYNGANMINSMWIILGSWISSLLLSNLNIENIP
jgi:hypothetical protein